MEVVIVRPVLVYGPGVRANFLSMMRWLDRGIPLPFGAIHNRRSLVSVDNLADLLGHCVSHPDAPGHTFLVSDGHDLSTTKLLMMTAAALGSQARLIPIPATVLRRTLTALGKRDLATRLCDSLRVDIKATCAQLGWSPPYSVAEGLARTAQHFRRVSR